MPEGNTEDKKEEEQSGRKNLTTTVAPETKRALKRGEGPMGAQIDELVDDESKMDFHIVNTNAQHLDDDGTAIYYKGQVVTYGPDKYGRKLTNVDLGDGILSYVSAGEVNYGGGFKAFGIARAPFDGAPVDADEMIYPNEGHEAEFHLPVHWLAVLPDSRTVTPAEKRPLIGEQPTDTKIKARDEELRRGCRLTAEIILGRASYPLLR